MVRLDVTCDATTVYVVIVHFKGTSWTIETIGLSKDQKTQKVALLLCLRRVCDPKKSRLTFLEGKHCRRDELKWKMSGSLYFLSMINGTQKCFLFRKFKCQRVNIPILIELIRINFFALDKLISILRKCYKILDIVFLPIW